MTDNVGSARLRAVKYAIVVLSIAMVAAGTITYWASRDVPQSPSAWGIRGFTLAFTVAFGGVGLWILRYRPRNRIGWLLLTGAGVSAVQGLCEQWAMYALGARDGAIPGGVWAAWVVDWIWVTGVGLLAAVVLYFPDGKPVGERWRIVGRLAPVAVATSTVLLGLRSGAMQSWPADNPVGVLEYPYEMAGVMLLPFAAYLAAVLASLVIRTRRARGAERTQLRWLLVGAVPTLTIVIASAVVRPQVLGQDTADLMEALAVVSFVLLPIGIGIGILRYQLFDIDLAINRTLVVGALVAFVTVVYAALVGGIGALVGERANLALSMAATGLVAVGFHPVRMRVQRWSNRLVYGERSTPVEVLTAFAARLEDTVATDDLLQRTCELVADGTGANEVGLWLRVGDELRLAAVTPRGAKREPVAATDGRTPDFEGADHVSPVAHQGELLGAITLIKPRTEPVTSADRRLVDGLAGQAGLLLRNERLTAELRDLVDQLRASRQRLVAAQDEERRRLERDLHDGAQQQFVAVKLKAGLARQMAERQHGADDAAVRMLSEVADGIDEGISGLRELAHGIYPPLLEAEGLPAALRARADKAPFDVAVQANGLGRYPREVEAAVYFCVLEALQNVGKYAGATRAVVALGADDGHLEVSVTDDGQGFDVETNGGGRGLSNMRDRIEALGGTLEIVSEPAHGTTVTARVPADAHAPGGN